MLVTDTATQSPRQSSVWLIMTLGRIMKSNELIDKLDAVHDEETLVDFISALAADREDEARKEKAAPSSPYGRGANGWENGSIEAFLCASSAWAESSKNGMPLYPKPENPWKRFADILYAGKIYE